MTNPYTKIPSWHQLGGIVDMQKIRIAVLGSPGVGKTAIIQQFVCNEFTDEYVPTEKKQIYYPSVIINDHLFEVKIMDCPVIPYFPTNTLSEWTDYR